MSGTTVVMMVIVCGVVWGGFAWLLARAVRREGEKAPPPSDGRPGGAPDGGR